MGFFGFRQGFKPIGDFVEALFAGRFRHARIHIGVFVGFPGNGRLQVIGGAADGKARGGIANGFEKFQMAVSMAGFAFGGGPEHGGDIVVAFDVGLLGKIKITAVGLIFPGEGGFQVFFGLGPLEVGLGGYALFQDRM